MQKNPAWLSPAAAPAMVNVAFRYTLIILAAFREPVFVGILDDA